MRVNIVGMEQQTRKGEYSRDLEGETRYCWIDGVPGTTARCMPKGDLCRILPKCLVGQVRPVAQGLPPRVAFRPSLSTFG